MTQSYFLDVPNVQEQSLTGKQGGNNYLDNTDSLQVGYGNKLMRVDSNGLWLGAEKFVNAPFSVDMSGNVYAGSITVSGYIQTGGAAADVNGGTVTISGGKITANSVTATQIQTNTLTVGTNVNLGTAQTAGQVTTIVGNTITTGYVNALAITVLGAVTAGSFTGLTITSSSGSNKIVLNNGDTLDFYSSGSLTGQMRGGQASGIIANEGSFITYRQEGFYSATVTSGGTSDFFKFFCSNVSGVGISGVIEAPTGDRVYITKANGTTLLSTSDSQTYSLRRFVTDSDNIGIGGKLLKRHSADPGFGNAEIITLDDDDKTGLWVKDNWRYAFGNGHIYASDNGGNFNQIV